MKAAKAGKLNPTGAKQITAEHLEDVIVRGKIAGRKWAKTGENHFLDCAVYNYALADHLGGTFSLEDRRPRGTVATLEIPGTIGV